MLTARDGEGESSRLERALSRFQLGAVWLSVAWLVFIAVCYLGRWPGVVALTIFPPWFWAAFGLALAVVAQRRGCRPRFFGLLGAWAAFVVGFCEEPKALWTALGEWPVEGFVEAREEGRGLRVVSVNCAGGDEAAASEALALEPDVLLLQESPGRAELEALLQGRPELQLAYGIDASVVVRGKVVRVTTAPEDVLTLTALQADVRSQRIGVVSTRLGLPYTRPDIWRPGAWREARQAYEERLEEMRAVAARARELARTSPVIVGGDFNAPAGDRLFRELAPLLRDTFAEAGIGLGNTIINEIPLSRIDAVWVSEELRPIACVAWRTIHSDHRMVIADVLLEG